MNTGKLEQAEAIAILGRQSLGRLGCIADGEAYVVPVNYFFDGDDIYIHSLPGKKIDALRIHGRACLQVDEIQNSFEWRSVIAYGDYDEITDEHLRIRTMSELFKRLPEMTPVESKMTPERKDSIVFRLRVDRITGMGETW